MGLLENRKMYLPPPRYLSTGSQRDTREQGHPRKAYRCWAQEWEQDFQTMEEKGHSCSEKSKVVVDLLLPGSSSASIRICFFS